jgi:hypothetical protein
MDLRLLGDQRSTILQDEEAGSAGSSRFPATLSVRSEAVPGQAHRICVDDPAIHTQPINAGPHRRPVRDAPARSAIAHDAPR